MRISTQPDPPVSSSAARAMRLRGTCAAYRLPHVRELPQRLEAVAPDTFGGLVTSRAAARSRPSTIHPTGALS
jgi:hypothetical protein